MVYFDRGWSPLPLPLHAKKPPPSGFTGNDREQPTRADVGGWIAEGVYNSGRGSQQVGNVALRLPAGVLGIDVDHYGAKTGADAIASAEADLGPLPPTWISTSRPDTPSGIRLFRVPEGRSWRGLADVDAIHQGHRYAVVAPSVHPEGRGYVWVDPDGVVHDDATEVPTIADLPELPPAWVDYLSAPAGDRGTGAPVDADTVAHAIAAMPTGDPCPCIQRAAGKALATNAGRHDSYLPAVLAVLRHGRQGCPGAAHALSRMRAAFLAEITTGDGQRRSPTEAAQEWRGFFTGAAVGDVLADPQGAGCLNDPTTYGLTPAPENDPSAQADVARHMRVLQAADELRIRTEARELIAAEKAAAGYDPPPVLTLPDLIAVTEAEQVQWRWRDLAERGDRLLIEAAAKTGKTTLLANAVRSLLTGAPLVDHFDTTALADDEVLVYLDTELGPRRLSRWLAEVLDADARARVVVWSIAGRAGSLDVRDDATRDRMATQILDAVAGHRIGHMIVDVAAGWTAPLGIDENSNAEVRGWLESVHTFALDLNADGLTVAHHTGHNAERSRGASSWRDWPDVFATLTRGTTDDDRDTRYLSAVGRDVHVPESALHFDPDTRRLSLAGDLGLSRADTARQRIAATYVDTVAAVVADKPGLSTRSLRAAVIDQLRADSVTVKAAAVGEAVTTAANRGLIVNNGTGQRSQWITAKSDTTAPGHPRDTVTTTATPRVLPVSPTVSPSNGTPPCPVSRAPIQGAHTQTHTANANGEAVELPWEVAQ